MRRHIGSPTLRQHRQQRRATVGLVAALRAQLVVMFKADQRRKALVAKVDSLGEMPGNCQACGTGCREHCGDNIWRYIVTELDFDKALAALLQFQQ